MEVEVMGQKYESVETCSPKRHSKSMGLVLMAAVLAEPYNIGYLSSSRPRERSVDVPDLVREFELIQQKKSKLSSKEREAVVHKFNRTFKKVL